MASDTLQHLTDLLPVLRDLNAAAQRLAAALPGPAHPVDGAPSVAQALADIEAAIDDYCAVSVQHSGIFDDAGGPPQEPPPNRAEA